MAKIKTCQMLIDGEWVDAADKNTFDSINPASGQVWSRVPEATAADVSNAVEAADRAFNSGLWANMSPTERGHRLRKLGDLLVENCEELGGKSPFIVFDDVDGDGGIGQFQIVDTELFGPVLSVLRFRDEEEAVRMANNSRHGLAAGIFTRDGARSLRVVRKIKAGIG